MREYPFVIDKALSNGLRPERQMPRNTPYMRLMKNARATEFGALSPVPIVYPIEPYGSGFDWPFPQLMNEERVFLECGATAIYSVDGDAWTKTEINTYSASDPSMSQNVVRDGLWQLAAFRDNFLLTNGSNLLWKITANTSDKLLITTDIDVDSLCRYQDRLFLAGVSGSWFSGARFLRVLDAWRENLHEQIYVHEDAAIDKGWVFWCAPGGEDDEIPLYTFLCAIGAYGNAAFDKFEETIITGLDQQKWGMAWVRYPGTIRSVMGLGGKIILYGSEGISALEPIAATYQESSTIPVGIPGRGCAGGTDAEHIFADNDNQLWRYPQQSEPTRLGYSEYLRARPAYYRDWGAYGDGQGELAGGLYLTLNGRNVYVSESGNDRIQRFDRNGVYQQIISAGLAGPTAIAYYQDEIYVCDNGNSRIRVYDSGGSFVRQWGSSGTANGAFIGIFGIAVYGDEVYVTDAGNDRVQVFTTAGVFVRKWGTNGTANGRFIQPYGIAIDRCGGVFVVDMANHRIQRFNTAGIFISKWGSYGNDNGQFQTPAGIAIYNDEVYVTEYDSNRLQVFDFFGEYQRQYGQTGTGINELNGVLGVAILDDRVYLAETGNSRVQVWDSGLTNQMIISFDPTEKEYYIATQNNVHILRGQSLGGPGGGITTGCFRDRSDRLVGASNNEGSLVLQLRSQSMDIIDRGTKQINTVQAASNNLSDMRARIHYRYGNNACDRATAWTPFNLEGVAFPVASFSDGEISIKGTIQNNDARVERIELRYNAEDRRFYRGPKSSG